MSIPQRVWMREKYFLRENPFPSEAIMAEGSGEPSEDGTIFDPGINHDEIEQFFKKFIVDPAYSKGSSFGALWSLGRGEGARGFGKSSLGQYGAKVVCADFGSTILRKYGDAESCDTKALIASYARFDRNNVTNFHAIAFELVNWLTHPKRNMYSTPPIIRLRQRIKQRLATQGFSFNEGSDQEVDSIIRAVKIARSETSGTKIGPLNEEFLEKLVSADITDIIQFLDGVGTWHRTRNGFSYLDSLLSFAKAADINKAILFIDQVEDFANTGVPLYKRVKEVERFRDIVKETAPFNSMTYFILTMHPDALSSIGREWENARLPSLSYDKIENKNRVLVLHGIQSLENAEKLFKAYLNYSDYRIPNPPNELHPFTSQAIAKIQKLYGGKSGYMLRQANQILAIAAAENIGLIDEQYVSKITGTSTAKQDSSTQEQTSVLHKSLE